MVKTRKNTRTTINRKRLRGGGFMDFIRRKKKDDGLSLDQKVDLLIAALGGIEQVTSRAKNNAPRRDLENKPENKPENNSDTDKKVANDSDPSVEQLGQGGVLGTPPQQPPPTGGKKSKTRKKGRKVR